VVVARAYRPYQDVRRIDGMTREDICRRYESRLLKLAQRMHEQAGPEETMLGADDLISHGVVGLLEAFDRYEEGFGVDFGTFAEYRIRGSMLDALRSADPSTRRRRELAQQLDAARKALHGRDIAQPGHEEVAAEMGMEMEAYWQTLDHLAPVTLVPLEDALHVPEEPQAPRRLMAQEARGILRRAINTLPDRERKGVLLYYGRDCSLAEIAVLFGVTPARVCQILSSARGKLRAALQISVDIPSLLEGGDA